MATPLLRRPGPAVLLAVMAALAAAPVAAQVGVRPADQWIPTLESPDRIAGMNVPALVEKLAIRNGMVIADIGAGSGVLTGPLALATGPSGLVYASDIDQALLDHIEQRARAARLANVRIVLGSFTDPKLPQPVDLALMNDVLHHVGDRAGYIKAVTRHLKPGGRLAIIDFTAEGSPHRDDPTMIVTETQVDDWASAASLTRIHTIALYRDRYFVIYGRR